MEEKADNKGKISFDILLSCLHFYFSRMEMMVNEPKRKNSCDFTEGEKMDEAKERAEYLTIRVETLTELIEQLWAGRPVEEQTSGRILDICNELLA